MAQSDKPLNSAPPAVWILGAGYLGAALADELQAQGVCVAASSRTSRPQSWWRAWDFEQVADGLPPDLQDALTWVILLPPSASKQYLAHMQQLALSANAARQTQIVFASSTSVYGDAPRVCDEDSPLAPQTANAEVLAAAEQVWLNSDIANVAVLRLGGLYDDVRHPVRRLSGSGLAGGKRPVNMLHKKHAVAALADCIATGRSGIINVVEADHPSRAEFYCSAAARLGVPLPEFSDDDDAGGKTVISRHRYWSF